MIAMEARTGRKTRQPSRLRRRRVLIVADTHCTEPGRCVQRLKPRFVASMQALVVAPAHEPRSWVVDESGVLAEAEQRLETCTECLTTATGVTPATRVGDADPVQAIADALAEFPADEVLFVTPTPRHSRRNRRTVKRARRSFPMHVEHIVAGASGAAGAHEGAGTPMSISPRDGAARVVR
jgi:hypothetical protein